MPAPSDAELKRYDRFRDSYAKEIAERQKVAASLIAMSSALIALPILFFKDIFKETMRAGETLMMLILKQHIVVSLMAYTAWALLVFAIFLSLMFTMQAGKFLHNLYKFDYPPDYVHENAGERDLRELNRLSIGAVAAFLVGFGLMMSFVLSYVKVGA